MALFLEQEKHSATSKAFGNVETEQILHLYIHKLYMKTMCVPEMGTERGPPPLSSLLTHIHRAAASESPSFPLTVHLTMSRQEKNRDVQIKAMYSNAKMNKLLSALKEIVS